MRCYTIIGLAHDWLRLDLVENMFSLCSHLAQSLPWRNQTKDEVQGYLSHEGKTKVNPTKIQKMEKSALQAARAAYQPKLPKA